ncbi:MAG: uncharacterized protein JWP13_780 [Candidatus Saccharibacteria bacterium]|nr:uncharacterized protein [Candidatus Saccharibacteria bacterium]
MNDNLLLVGASVGLIVIMFIVRLVVKRRSPRALNAEYFQARWKELQKMCGDKTTWPLAIIDADKLLDEALRKSRVKGKTMGERLVTAQRTLSNNDAVWFAHKLRNKLVHEDMTNLKEADVKNALIGFRQALKDLGALK